MIGLWEFAIIIVVLVLIFGTARFSRAWRSVKQGGKGLAREIRSKDEQLPPPPSDDA